MINPAGPGDAEIRSGWGKDPDLLAQKTRADYFVPEMKNKILLQGTSERVPALVP
jgi:hypothetical protein